MFIKNYLCVNVITADLFEHSQQKPDEEGIFLNFTVKLDLEKVSNEYTQRNECLYI